MRKILIFLVLIISINSFGQNPANYQYRVVYERLRGLMPDSVFHLPRYNGVPSGLRGGSSTQDGAIAGDTLNHAVYFYSGSLWNKLLSIRDTLSISTRAWRQKGIDSVVGLLSGLTDTHFGNTNLTQTANRTYAGAGFDYTFNNLGTWTQNFGTLSYYQRLKTYEAMGLRDYGVSGAQVVRTAQTQPNNSYYKTSVNDSTFGSHIYQQKNEGIWLFAYQNDDFSETDLQSHFNVLPDSITFRPFLGQINIDSLRTQYGDTTTWKPLVWSPHNKGVKKFNSWGEIGLGGGTPTLQQVTTAGNVTSDYLDITNSTSFSRIWAYGGISIENAGTGNGITYTRTDLTNTPVANLGVQSNSGTLEVSNTANVSTKYQVNKFIDGSNNSFRFPTTTNGSGLDTLLSLQDLRNGGGGGGSGTVTDVSVVTANGFSGSVATSTTTPAITINNNNVNFQTWYQKYLQITAPEYGAFYFAASGTGAAVAGITSSIPAGWMFGHKMSTGTTTTGFAFYYTQVGGTYGPMLIASTTRYNFGVKVRLEDLSDGTDTYTYYCGFGDDATAVASIVDGVYFSYTHSASSGQFVCNTEAANTVTSVASGITVAADTDYELEISVFNGHAYFYIDKVQVADITTNIPTAETSIVNVLKKSAGTNNRDARINWMAYGFRNN